MRIAALIGVLLVALPSMAQRGNRDYYEDLSVWRPRYSNADSVFNNSAGGKKDKPGVVPQLTVNDKVNAVLDSIDRLNAIRKFVDGFTIQIYSGQSREEANNAKKTMVEQVADMKADLQYLQPKFRVKTGSYFTRLEAQKDLTRLKRIFPNAILVPERIAIR
jgi:hypothetical protein